MGILWIWYGYLMVRSRFLAYFVVLRPPPPPLRAFFFAKFLAQNLAYVQFL